MDAEGFRACPVICLCISYAVVCDVVRGTVRVFQSDI